ncbi:MAG: response regulator [Enterocloster bolteae]
MKGYHILLGEDEPDILEYNREQLEQRGYQVTAVSTLGQAESCVLRDNPDLLVLDVMMPDGSGVDLCRRLREQFQGSILFLTSLGRAVRLSRGSGPEVMIILQSLMILRSWQPELRHISED